MTELFISAGAVGEGRPIVVMLVGGILSEKHTVWHSKNIAKQQRAGRPTGKRKEGEECKTLKKPWLIHLQHLLLSMIDYLKITRLLFLVAIFAVEKVWLLSIFHDGDMGGGIRESISSHSDILGNTWSIENPLIAIASGR